MKKFLFLFFDAMNLRQYAVTHFAKLVTVRYVTIASRKNGLYLTLTYNLTFFLIRLYLFSHEISHKS